MRLIQVSPFGAGWSVGEVSLANAQFFESAAHAEAAALSLGQRLADVGQPTEVHIRLSNGQPGARFICVAAEADAQT